VRWREDVASPSGKERHEQASAQGDQRSFLVAALIVHSILCLVTVAGVLNVRQHVVLRHASKHHGELAGTATSTCLRVTPDTDSVATATAIPEVTQLASNADSDQPLARPDATACLEETPLAEVRLSRGPYLQSVQPHSVIIAWETSRQVAGAVEYGRTRAYASTCTDDNLTQRHAITLTGLSPYSTYHYRVSIGHLDWSGDFAFRTAAGPQRSSFKFAVIGDTHSGVYEFPRRRRDIDGAHRLLLKQMATLAPDFYLHTGDLVQEGGDLAAWEDFFSIEGGLMAKVCMFPTLGNHERNHDNYFDFFYLPHNERWYSFDYGNAHFVSLEVDGYADIERDSEQYRWLVDDLSSSNSTWRFIFFHFPSFSSGGEYGSNPQVQEHLVPVFNRYGVNMVFNGHEHNYQRNVVDSVTYLQTSGGGAITRPPGEFEWTCYAEETRHIIVVSVDGDRLDAVAIRPDGSRFDPFTLHASQG
jgi:hypothetical protein